MTHSYGYATYDSQLRLRYVLLTATATLRMTHSYGYATYYALLNYTYIYTHARTKLQYTHTQNIHTKRHTHTYLNAHTTGHLSNLRAWINQHRQVLRRVPKRHLWSKRGAPVLQMPFRNVCKRVRFAGVRFVRTGVRH